MATTTKKKTASKAKAKKSADKPKWGYQANEKAENQGNRKKVRRVLIKGTLKPTDPDATVYNEDGSITVTPLGARGQSLKPVTVARGSFSKELRFW